jgi:hypothetical protein
MSHRNTSGKTKAPLDPAFLDALARRLAEQCGLPLAMAKARVMALAISARP